MVSSLQKIGEGRVLFEGNFFMSDFFWTNDKNKHEVAFFNENGFTGFFIWCETVQEWLEIPIETLAKIDQAKADEILERALKHANMKFIGSRKMRA